MAFSETNCGDSHLLFGILLILNANVKTLMESGAVARVIWSRCRTITVIRHSFSWGWYF